MAKLIHCIMPKKLVMLQSVLHTSITALVILRLRLIQLHIASSIKTDAKATIMLY